MHITSLLNDRNVSVGLETSSKEECIELVLSVMGKSSKVVDLGAVKSAVLEREEMATTGVGEGIAIPHAKTSAVSDIAVSVAILKQGVDFRSKDDQPVNIVFLLVGMESRVGTYLKILSRARRLLRSASFRKKLLKSKSSADVIEAFRKEEERYFDTTL